MVTSQSELTTRRVPVVTAVTCEAGPGNPSRILSMLDLSEGGFFIQTAFPLGIGTRLQCCFHLGDQPEPLHVHAEVAWVRPGPEDMMPPPGMGLRFLRMQTAVLDRIRTVIARHNAQIQYFQQHQQLSEDAMLLAVPRVSLATEDQPAVDCRLESWNGRNLVVTLALPFEPGQTVQAQGGDGMLSEQGRISWIQFVPQGHDGPELAVGLELQMQTWGQELVQRRPSSEILTGDGDSEWDYEILQSVPASMTLAPTLPICEEAAPVALEFTRPVSISAQHGDGTPDHSVSPAKSLPVEPATPPAPRPSEALLPQAPRPQPAALSITPEDASAVPVTWAPRFPAPQIPTDTYPVSMGVSSGGWPLNAKATLIVFGVVLGGLGLFGFLGAENTNHPRRPGSPKMTWSSFLERPERSWPLSRGAHVRIQSSSLQAADSAVKQAPPGPPETTTAPASPPADPPEAREVPVRYSSKGTVSRLTLELDAPPQTRNFYTLADPAGVVIDLEGARILQKSGFLGGDGKRIRKLKVVPMSTKSRLIVYTHTLPGRIQVESQGNRLTVQLHFADTLARR
ncbi:PilZ domain-containing protein [Myxococcota bacterium]|nr:PilZ domain-containing protein [Myxococcota bacterium]